MLSVIHPFIHYSPLLYLDKVCAETCRVSRRIKSPVSAEQDFGKALQDRYLVEITICMD
jgi:hypothetical protein